jgi:signal transduction histidine kinase
VASQWRIRHKLMLGLALVVGIMTLLLGATLRGLVSYRATVNGLRDAHRELKLAEDLKDAIARFENAVDPVKQPDEDAIRAAITATREKLDAYQPALDETARGGYCDPVRIETRQRYVLLLTEHLVQCGTAAENEEMTRPLSQPGGRSEDLFDKRLAAVRDHVKKMETIGFELSDNINGDLNKTFEDRQRLYQTPMWIIIPATLGLLLLLAGLSWACYAWVVYPIRDLEAGVIRVAQGDFGHRIKLNSGDEMQDLAEAFNDMTQRLQALYNDLARQVNERSRQLVRSEKLASVGFLAAGVAHEINNPLASIAFCSEALEARLATLMRLMPTSVQRGDDLEVFTRYLKMIQQEAFRCKTITEKLLDFSRNGEKRREPTDLGQLVQSVLDITQHLQSSKGKEIAFEANTERVPGGRITAPVNAEEIKSVVLNLVVNALDSMEDGGRLTISLCQRDGMAQMQFHDTGCGMSQEVLENIFEPFFTRSRTGKGTGLGLTISHRIIHQHGGEIEAASAGPNQGSTFTVRLPVQLIESSTAPDPPRTPVRSLAA